MKFHLQLITNNGKEWISLICNCETWPKFWHLAKYSRLKNFVTKYSIIVYKSFCDQFQNICPNSMTKESTYLSLLVSHVCTIHTINSNLSAHYYNSDFDRDFYLAVAGLDVRNVIGQKYSYVAYLKIGMLYVEYLLYLVLTQDVYLSRSGDVVELVRVEVGDDRCWPGAPRRHVQLNLDLFARWDAPECVIKWCIVVVGYIGYVTLLFRRLLYKSPVQVDNGGGLQQAFVIFNLSRLFAT